MVFNFLLLRKRWSRFVKTGSFFEKKFQTETPPAADQKVPLLQSGRIYHACQRRDKITRCS